MREKTMVFNKQCEVEMQGALDRITDLDRETNVIILAIDSGKQISIEGATFYFPNRTEGLHAFNFITNIAKDVYLGCVEETENKQKPVLRSV
ncbi:MAG TPA: hypothetical protein VGB26_13545 [Nitrospiria bacterium]|jgi:hypothetical protein